MHVALIILSSIVGVGLILFIHHRLTSPDKNSQNAKDTEPGFETKEKDGECCGLHLNCEKNSLSPDMSEPIIYYDDEELDDYIGLSRNEYNAEQIEQFRDVLQTLRPEEVAPWARSIQQRGIILPEPIQDELFILVGETRQG